MGKWLARFKDHPIDCAGHILWGFIGGRIGGVDGGVFTLGGVAYQFGSGWKKASEGHLDTVGCDAADYPIGYVIGVLSRNEEVQNLCNSVCDWLCSWGDSRTDDSR